MRHVESSRETVQRRKNSCLRDAYVFSLWHTSIHQRIAVIGGQCRSRADNLQPGSVEAGCVMPCTQEQPLWLGDETIIGSSHVHLLGVTVSSDLITSKHVSSTSSSCFYWFHQIRRLLDTESAKTLFTRFRLIAC